MSSQKKAQSTDNSLESQPTKRQRRTLSCLPCREHKFRCSRSVPCQACCRYGREEQCRQNPAPETIMAASLIAPKTIDQSLLSASSPSLVTSSRPRMPLTPSSIILEEQVHESHEVHAKENCTTGIVDASSDTWEEAHNAKSPVDIIAKSSMSESQTVASKLVYRSADVFQRCLFDEPVSYWKHCLVTCLPSPTQCDMLVSYFFENINWMYQSIHAPSFRKDYTAFWAIQVEDVDLTWLALLLTILALGAAYVPSVVAEAVGLSSVELPKLSRRWYNAARQSLDAGGHGSRPSLVTIQVFIVSQSYWYCNKAVETLNFQMGQTVRIAQALGLDKEAPRSIKSCVERELRHRLWWDLACSDTFQSLCLGRPTLIQSHISTVPLPSNCNDVDLTPTSILDRPLSEPTEMSIHCFRARIFKIFNKLYIENGYRLSSYSFVEQIDGEITELMDTFPWYLKHEAKSIENRLPPSLANVILWMRHVLHSAICIQRVRMYRPFLNPIVGDSWLRCVTAGTSALTVYHSLRASDLASFQRCQKMHVHAYQIFSVAVALATFLLVEMPSNPDPIRADIELVIEDLSSHCASFDEARWVPLISDGCRVIRRILALFDARCKQRRHVSATPSDDPSFILGEGPTALVPAISSVFGGETTTRRYLERCSIEQILNHPISKDTRNQRSAAGTAGMEAWDTLLDLVQSREWNDSFWLDLDRDMGLGPDMF